MVEKDRDWPAPRAVASSPPRSPPIGAPEVLHELAKIDPKLEVESSLVPDQTIVPLRGL